MDFTNLKKAVESIEMPDDMQNRITENCRVKAAKTTEEYAVNKNWFKRPVAVAAALCICLPVAGMAMGDSGFFKDITGWDGAVTGLVYEQASNEIEVTVDVVDGELAVTAAMRAPDMIPYSECEAFSIGSYQIIDAAGNVVAKGSNTDSTEIIDGKATLYIPLDGIGSGAYQLLIDSFTGSKKADQPLSITGFWECAFTISYTNHAEYSFPFRNF